MKERKHKIEKLKESRKEGMQANQEMKFKLEQKRREHNQKENKLNRQEQELTRMEFQTQKWKQFLEQRRINMSAQKEIKRIQTENPWIVNKSHRLTEQQVKDDQAAEQLKKEYLEQVQIRKDLMREMNINSIDDFKFQSLDECEEERRRIVEQINNSYLLGASLAFWDAGAELASFYAKMTQKVERMKAVIALNNAILQVSDTMQSTIDDTTQSNIGVLILSKDFKVFNDLSTPFQLVVTKGGEMLFNQDRELSGGQKSIIALIIILAFQRVIRQPIILLDEVDAALDVRNSKIAAKLIQKFVNRAKIQVIAVSHRKDLPQLADKVIKVGREQNVAGSQKIQSVDKSDLGRVFKEIERSNDQQEAQEILFENS